MSSFTEPQFFIKSGDMGFLNRQKDIFDLLNVAEKVNNERKSGEPLESEVNVMSCDESVDVSLPVSRSKKRLRSEMRQFRGKESIFKRPEAPPPRFKVRGIPDFKKNPHKWIKYSLGDVSQDDMSEKSNTAAALSFLRELEARKNVEPMDDNRGENAIIFKAKKKIVTQDNNSSTNIAKSTFRSTKLIMPEYVVGQEKKKAKKNVRKLSSEGEKSNKSIKLSHLEEEEDD